MRKWAAKLNRRKRIYHFFSWIFYVLSFTGPCSAIFSLYFWNAYIEKLKNRSPYVLRYLLKYDSDNLEFLFIEKNFYKLLESIVLPSSQDTYRFFSGDSNPYYIWNYATVCGQGQLSHIHTLVHTEYGQIGKFLNWCKKLIIVIKLYFNIYQICKITVLLELKRILEVV